MKLYILEGKVGKRRREKVSDKYHSSYFSFSYSLPPPKSTRFYYSNTVWLVDHNNKKVRKKECHPSIDHLGY